MKPVFFILTTILCLSVSVLAADDLVELEQQIRAAASELNGVATLTTDSRNDRSRIDAASKVGADLLGQILNNDHIRDETELRMLEPLVEAYGKVLLSIGAGFVDPHFDPSDTRVDPINPWYDQYQEVVRRSFVKRAALGTAAFGMGILRDLSIATGVLYKPEGQERKILTFPPPATPFFGADSKRNRTLRSIILDLRSALEKEYEEAKGDATQLGQAGLLFRSLIGKMTKSEPMAYAKVHILHAIIVITIAQLLVLNGVELWYERTELGADIFAGIYELTAASMVYVRYKSAGLPVWRLGNQLRAMVATGSTRIPFFCRLGIRSIGLAH